MEQEKRGRGRPKIDTRITEVGAPSRRQAINALKAGCTSREIEKAIRNVRTANKRASADPDSEWLHRQAVKAANELRDMGGADE